MKTRTLKRTDLPEKNLGSHSLHLEVIYKEKQRIVADIHYANNTLCYLENGDGKPVYIKDCQLVLSQKNLQQIKENEEYQKEINQD